MYQYSYTQDTTFEYMNYMQEPNSRMNGEVKIFFIDNQAILSTICLRNSRSGPTGAVYDVIEFVQSLVINSDTEFALQTVKEIYVDGCWERETLSCTM